MTAHFRLEITSPDRQIPAQNVAEVVIPGEMGELGIMAGHAPIVASLKSGVVSVYAESDSIVTSRYLIKAGFAEVTFTDCLLIVDSVIPFNEMNAESLTVEIESLVGSLDGASEEKKADIKAKIDIAKEKLHALMSAQKA